MIGNALKQEIERYAAEVRTDNALYRGAAEGKLSEAHLECYLTNVLHLIEHTPRYLERARARAEALGDHALERYYAHKIREEEGHDEWAKADLLALDEPRDPDAADGSRASIMPSLRALLAGLADVIDRDPSLYLSYILFAEYITVLIGPSFLELLERRCGIPRLAMTVVDHHVTLDRDHVEEALDEIDALVTDAARLPAMRRSLRMSIELFDRFCAEVAEQGEHWERGEPEGRRLETEEAACSASSTSYSAPIH